jgi:hypothetical protein
MSVTRLVVPTVCGVGVVVLVIGAVALAVLPLERDSARAPTACPRHATVVAAASTQTTPPPKPLSTSERGGGGVSWNERVAHAKALLYQDRELPTSWRVVGNVHGNERAFRLHRRRNRMRRRWEYRVEDRYGVMLDLDRAHYREHLDDGTAVAVPGYGDMSVQNDTDCEWCHFEQLEN